MKKKLLELRSIENLKRQLNKLPGIGPKTAARLAYYIIKMPYNEAKNLIDAIAEAKEKIRYCKECFNISENEVCSICSDDSRDKSIICIVQEPHNLITIEKTGEYQGLYHVLLGALSPLHGIGPEDIKIKELIDRVKKGKINEIIIATNPNIEGEATSSYLIKLLKPMGIKISRIAFGVPMGADLDYVDEATMARAISGRISA